MKGLRRGEKEVFFRLRDSSASNPIWTNILCFLRTFRHSSDVSHYRRFGKIYGILLLHRMSAHKADKTSSLQQTKLQKVGEYLESSNRKTSIGGFLPITKREGPSSECSESDDGRRKRPNECSSSSVVSVPGIQWVPHLIVRSLGLSHSHLLWIHFHSDHWIWRQSSPKFLLLPPHCLFSFTWGRQRPEKTHFSAF